MRDTCSCSFSEISHDWQADMVVDVLHTWKKETVMQSVSSFTSANYSVCENENLCMSLGATLA